MLTKLIDNSDTFFLRFSNCNCDNHHKINKKLIRIMKKKKEGEIHRKLRETCKSKTVISTSSDIHKLE
jgi:hypothetical protein